MSQPRAVGCGNESTGGGGAPKRVRAFGFKAGVWAPRRRPERRLEAALATDTYDPTASEAHIPSWLAVACERVCGAAWLRELCKSDKIADSEPRRNSTQLLFIDATVQ